MALATPNVVAFRARFPELERLKDPDIQAALDDADGDLSASAWDGKRDYPRAVLYLAAHNLALRQMALASGRASRGINSIDTFVRSIGFGERRVMWGERNLGRSSGYKYGAGEEVFQQTVYGEAFLRIVARNFLPGMLA